MNLISKQIDWLIHPQYSDADPIDWFAFLILVLLAGLLWSKVVRSIVEG